MKLPKADIKTPVDQTEPIIINITSRNEIFLKNKPKTLNELKYEIQSLTAFNKTRPGSVRADKSVVFDRVVQVLDIAKNAGMERLGIAIEEKTPINTFKP